MWCARLYCEISIHFADVEGRVRHIQRAPVRVRLCVIPARADFVHGAPEPARFVGILKQTVLGRVVVSANATSINTTSLPSHFHIMYIHIPPVHHSPASWTGSYAVHTHGRANSLYAYLKSTVSSPTEANFDVDAVSRLCMGNESRPVPPSNTRGGCGRKTGRSGKAAAVRTGAATKAEGNSECEAL